MKHCIDAEFNEGTTLVECRSKVTTKAQSKLLWRVCVVLGCGTIFQYSRSTAKYCSDNCRQSACRPRQNSFDSPTKRRTNLEYWDRALLGYDNLMKQMPISRAQWLQDYIDNPTSKCILCNPQLLMSDRNNLAKIANRFTKTVYGVSIKTYMDEIRDSPDKISILFDYSAFEKPLSDLIIGVR
jgi:hypothetical protein